MAISHWYWHLVVKNRNFTLLLISSGQEWLMHPKWIKHRCLEYHYTKLGRQTYFGWWIPQWIENRCLEYHYTKLGRQTFFGQWTPSESSIDALNTVHKTWQTNIIWQMDHLGNSTPNLADKHTLANGPPSESSIDAFNTVHKTWQTNILWQMDAQVIVHQNWQTNLLWPMDTPSELKIDALITATPNLADKPTLANGPPNKNGFLEDNYTENYVEVI